MRASLKAKALFLAAIKTEPFDAKIACEAIMDGFVMAMLDRKRARDEVGMDRLEEMSRLLDQWTKLDEREDEREHA